MKKTIVILALSAVMLSGCESAEEIDSNIFSESRFEITTRYTEFFSDPLTAETENTITKTSETEAAQTEPYKEQNSISEVSSYDTLSSTNNKISSKETTINVSENIKYNDTPTETSAAQQNTNETVNSIKYQAVTDQFGFNEENLITDLYNYGQTDFTAVITDSKELRDYLSEIYGSSIVQKYSEKYDNRYFEDYVLLLNSVYQSFGTEPFLNVDSVTVSEQCVYVTAKWNIPDIADDVMSVLLVQISLSKDTYRNYSVVWDISE